MLEAMAKPLQHIGVINRCKMDEPLIKYSSFRNCFFLFSNFLFLLCFLPILQIDSLCCLNQKHSSFIFHLERYDAMFKGWKVLWVDE
jgi:hypothetical protein